MPGRKAPLHFPFGTNALARQQLAQILSGFRLGQLIQPGIENRLVRLDRLSRPAFHARTRQQILVNLKKLGQCHLGTCPFL